MLVISNVIDTSAVSNVRAVSSVSVFIKQNKKSQKNERKMKKNLISDANNWSRLKNDTMGLKQTRRRRKRERHLKK